MAAFEFLKWGRSRRRTDDNPAQKSPRAKIQSALASAGRLKPKAAWTHSADQAARAQSHEDERIERLKLAQTGPWQTLRALQEQIQTLRFPIRRPGLIHNTEQLDREEVQKAILSDIAVVAFVGPSGTGKSTRAIQVASRHNIHYLIDDGLLIHGSRILAGTSAKRASTKLESVRQALFLDDNRAATMRRCLAEQAPTTLMIIGTSDKMLERICASLHLNPPSMLIRIEDVSSEEERRQAKTTRLMEGQHTIPVPSMEIKHEFSGAFAEPLSRIRERFGRDRSSAYYPHENARTVVRPTFSSLGSYSISDDAMLQMIAAILSRAMGVERMLSCRIHKEVYGIIIRVELSLRFGYNAQDVMRRVQSLISRDVEYYTSINVLAVNVQATKLAHSRAPLRAACPG